MDPSSDLNPDLGTAGQLSEQKHTAKHAGCEPQQQHVFRRTLYGVGQWRACVCDEHERHATLRGETSPLLRRHRAAAAGSAHPGTRHLPRY